MVSQKITVLVAGAGPTGLVVANILARQGVAFRIIDKKAGTTEESRALVVHAKTLELLSRLGLSEQAVADGQQLDAVVLLKNGKNPRQISFFGHAQDNRTPYPFALVFEQNKSERLLLNSLEKNGGHVEWETELETLTQISAGVQVTLRRADGSRENIQADWVVGADGSHSPIRHALGLGFEGSAYEQGLFLADVDMEWELGNKQVYLNLTTQGFMAFFPMPGHNRYRLLGNVPPEAAFKNSGQDKQQLTLEDLQMLMDKYSGLDTKITAARWVSLYHTHHRITEHFRVGRVFLVGDAAHIHSPAGGQGMNTGIGDAYNLAWKLALVAKGEASPTLLDSYEPERMPFARAILNGSDKAFSLMAIVSPLAQRLKLLTLPLLFRSVSSTHFTRERLFWMVSQLWTQYRHSPAVVQADAVKNVLQAGDRAPYGFFNTGENAGQSFFDKISGLNHHLLFFEGITPKVKLSAASEEISNLLERYKLPINMLPVAAENNELHKSYGVTEATLFLIRPDGHIAYRGAATDILSLKLYLDQFFTRRDSVEQPTSKILLEEVVN